MIALQSVSAGDVAVFVAKTVVVLAFLLVGFRLLGTRSLAQFNIYDLAMLMALSNSIQNSIQSALTGGRGNLAVGLAVSTTIVGAVWALHRLVLTAPVVARGLIGEPVIVVRRGARLTSVARHQRVTDEELDAAIRSHVLADISNVDRGTRGRRLDQHRRRSGRRVRFTRRLTDATNDAASSLFQHVDRAGDHQGDRGERDQRLAGHRELGWRDRSSRRRNEPFAPATPSPSASYSATIRSLNTRE